MANFTDKDRGYKKMMKAFRSNGRKRDPHVQVGLRGDGKAGQTAKGGDLTIAEIGSIHEFGVSPNPERSFLRSTFDRENPKLLRLLAKLSKRVAVGKLSVKDALDLLGAKAKADVQATMNKGIPPVSLVDGRVIRLIKSGDLKGSIEWKVVGA